MAELAMAVKAVPTGTSGRTHGWTGLLLFLVIIAMARGAGGQDGNRTRISAFVIGAVTPNYNPFVALFVEDPQFVYGGYPITYPLGSYRERQKIARRYYPRTGRDLVENYEVMVFHEARIEHMSPRHFQDIHTAFTEEGMVGASSPGMSWDTAWITTVLYELTPVTRYYDYVRNSPYRVAFDKAREPVFAPFVELGIEKVIGENYHLMTPKEGSMVWADMKPNGWPWLVSMKSGGPSAGMMWVFTGCFDAPWWGLAYGPRDHNPYVVDLVTNLLFHSLDIPLISDVHARREARRVLAGFQAQKLLVLHMMEWADNFGANILPLSERLTALEAEAQGAVDFYLEQDYVMTISHMESMNDKIIEITDHAVRLKNEALAWVYVTEWLVVSSVGMVAGVAVWSLMVRRRVYREVGATRLRETAWRDDM
jgi:hypothetical protein